jgi:hypothetical protein
MAFACILFGCIVLIPVYGTDSASKKSVFSIESMTMGNVQQGSNRLWSSVVAVYLYTALFLALMFKEYKYFVANRQKYFKYGDPAVPKQLSYSVLVENIPTDLRTSEKLTALFESIFPKEVFGARVLLQVDPLLKACDERKKILVLLEGAIAKYESSGHAEKKEVKVKNGKVALCGGVKVDAIEFYSNELKKWNDIVEHLMKEAIQVDQQSNGASPSPPPSRPSVQSLLAGFKKNTAVCPAESGGGSEELDHSAFDHFSAKSVTGTGLVTFNTRAAQTTSYQLSYMFEQYPEIVVTPAPAPSTIVWANVGVTPRYTRIVSSFTSGLFYVGLLFWAAILAFVAAISSLSNLERFLPFLKQLDPASKAILQGQLPVVALIVFIALLPKIFTATATMIEKRKAQYDIQLVVLKWYYGYQLANVYLLLIGGSIFGALSSALARPASVITLLAQSMPGVSTFFINYILTQTISGLPIILLNAAPVVVYKLYRMIFKEPQLTARALSEGPLAPIDVNYALVIPPVLYVFCITIMYWVIAPLVTVAGGLFFGAAYVTWKYRFLYLIAPSYESGGEFWYKIFTYSMTGLMFSTVTMIGYMGVKEGAVQAPLLLPLPFGIMIFWRYMETKFEKLSRNMAYSLACEDESTPLVGEGDQLERGKTADSFIVDYFTPPVLKGPMRQGPFPYRLNGEPLYDRRGHIHESYHIIEEIPEGGNISVSLDKGGQPAEQSNSSIELKKMDGSQLA